MIVARLIEPPKKTLVTGSCHIKGYHDSGWFPIDSFGFGIQEKADSGAKDGGGTTPGKPSGNQTAPATKTPAAGGSGDETKIQISKQVDTGSTDLMRLCLEDRKKTKGAESKIQADIHIISSVTTKGQKYVYPSLMLHLEAVLVKDWSIQASGEQRPTESMSLWCDRIAMLYYWTPDGKQFMAYGPRGWDQTSNTPFTWEDAKWKAFLPPPA